MIKNNLEEEARWLYEQGGNNIPAGKGIGYREFYPYFDNDVTLDEVIENIQKDSRHYAKRQLTWFRNKMDVTWYDIIKNHNNIYNIENDVNKWINYKKNDFLCYKKLHELVDFEIKKMLLLDILKGLLIMKEKDLRRSLSVLPIGTVMKLTDLTARQIRYYEEQKLVIPKRNEGNRRMYSLNNIDELLEIKDYLSDGLNISDIKKIYDERASKKS